MRRAETALRGWIVAVLVMLAAPVLAQKAPAGGSERVRPGGPVKINANKAEWEKGGAMVYSGNVRLESGDLKLSGDKLVLRQAPDGQFEAKIDGGPAVLDHTGLPESDDPKAKRPPVSAQARQLTYDSRSDIIDVTGDAVLTRGADRIKGENIRYDVVQRRIQAAGGEGGQVQIEIEVPQRQAPGDALPAPEAPAVAP